MPRKRSQEPDDFLAQLDALAEGEDPGLVEVELSAPRKRKVRQSRSSQQRIDDATGAKKSRDSQGNSPRSSRASSDETDPLAILRPVPGARGCHGKNLMGNPCGAIAMNAGTKLRDKKGEQHAASGGWCIMHDPDLPDAREFNFGGPQKNTGPKPKQTSDQIMRKLVIEHAGILMEPYLRALGAKMDEETGEIRKIGTGLMLFGTSKDGDVYVSDHEDIGGQMKAAEMLYDRVLGKPKQQTEMSGKDGGPVVVEVPMTEERVSAVAAVLQSVGALPSKKGKK